MSWQRDLTRDTGSRSNFNCRNKSIRRGLAYHRKLYKLLEAWQKVSAPEQQLEVEPWLRNHRTDKWLQPDAVLVEPSSNTGIVIEVKLNWKDGRDEKLIQSYIPAVRQAFGLELVWPALITSNVRGLQHKPLLGLGQLNQAVGWEFGHPTPVILVP